MNEENEKEHRIQAGLDEGEVRARRYHEGNIIAAREAEAAREIDADDDYHERNIMEAQEKERQKRVKNALDEYEKARRTLGVKARIWRARCSRVQACLEEIERDEAIDEKALDEYEKTQGVQTRIRRAWARLFQGKAEARGEGKTEGRIKIPPFWRVEEWEQHSLGDYIAKVTYFGNEGEAKEYAEQLAQDALATQAGEEGDLITVTNREGATVYSILLRFDLAKGQLVFEAH